MANKTFGDAGVNYGDSFYNYNGIVENYSREEGVSLPSTVADLTTPFTDADYIAVATEDASYVVQSASGTGNSIFEFKNLRAGTQVQVKWIGKTNLNCSASPVQLQIWNITNSTWDILVTDSTSVANVNFTLTSTISPLTNYKDTNGFVACRVWQNAVSSSSSSRSSSSSSSSCRSSSSSSSSSSRSSSSSSSSCRSSSSSSSSSSRSSSSSSSSSSSRSSSSSSCRSSSSSSSSSSRSSSSSSSSSSRSSSSSSSRSSSSSSCCSSSSSSSSSSRSSSSSSCRSSSSSSSASPCWVAAEIYGEDYTKPETWKDVRTLNAQYYIRNIAPNWLREGYTKYGERIAGWLHKKQWAKIFVSPIIHYFSFRGKRCQ